MISKQDICVKCNLEYDPIRWSKCSKICAAKGKSKNAYGGGYFVCDECLDDNIRHRIIENYIGYDNDLIDEQKLNQLLYFLNFLTRFDFYDWFMREASQYNLYDLSLYTKLKTTSAYPIAIKHLINYICDSNGDEFNKYIDSNLDNYSNLERSLIKSNIPRQC
jgi:hypothetical protein